MAVAATTYSNEVRAYFDVPTSETQRTYGGQFYGGQRTYGAYSIKRARTRFTNESRFRDENKIR